MSSKTQVRLPVIDFSNQYMKPDCPEWDLVQAQVRAALEDYGCFEATFDQVSKLRKEIFGATEQVFDLPLATKQLYVSDKPFRGYYGVSSGVGQECMVIDDAPIVENIEQGVTNTLWPQGNMSFSKTMVSFTELASRLEKTIRRMILRSFGLEKYENEFINSTNYLLKLMKYEGSQTKDQPSLRGHSDQNITTLLHQNDVNGLEVQKKDGEWISVKPSPNSFIFLIGESLSVWLNGRLWSPYHHVMVNGNKVRYSVGLFALPRGGYNVKVPEELVDEKNVLLFKPFDYEEFLRSSLSKVAPGALLGCGLKDYASV